MPASINPKYDDFFQSYPLYVWRKAKGPLRTDEEMYKYINTHIIPITPTKAGLVSDMKQAIENEREYKGGLAWFSIHKFDSIDDVYSALYNINTSSSCRYYFKRKNPKDHEVVQRGLDKFNKRNEFFINIQYMNRLILDGQVLPDRRETRVSNLSDFMRFKENIVGLAEAYRIECKQLDSLKSDVEKITRFMGLHLPKSVLYKWQQKDAVQFIKYKEYWNKFEELNTQVVLPQIIHYVNNISDDDIMNLEMYSMVQKEFKDTYTKLNNIIKTKLVSK
jgi:hypothetical protein